MKSIVLTCILVFTTVLALASWFEKSESTTSTPTLPKKPRVAVLPIADETTPSSSLTIKQGNIDRSIPLVQYSRDSYGAITRSKMESTLARWSEVSLADRFQMGLVMRETELNRFLARVKSMPEWKEDPITHFVLIELLSIDSHSSRFSGYGITLQETVYTAILRIRVIDFASRGVVFSTESTGTFAISQSKFVQIQVENPQREAVVAAMDALTRDPQFRNDLLAALTRQPREGGKMQPEETVVVFDALPERAAVEINGVVVGTGKVTRRLLRNQRYEVRIFKAGYQDWTGTIEVDADMVIAPELLPSNRMVPTGGSR